MFRMEIEELKLSFVMSVYESITKQIQQMDMKASIILSWNGVIAVLLSHEFGPIVHAERHKWSLLLLGIGVACSLVYSGVYCYKVLRPRIGAIKDRFDGLLWCGDIHKLGITHSDRIATYMNQLLQIQNHDELYKQFVTSIVLISEIQLIKNRTFQRALLSTVVSFSLLIALMTIIGLNLYKI